MHHSMQAMLHHAQLGHRNDRIDLSNIPHHIKNMIIDQSAAKLKDYEPLKEVYKCGFCADPKELYRPLDCRKCSIELIYSVTDSFINRPNPFFIYCVFITGGGMW
eukprot:jgi/Hompol1/7074/HPOL_005180-RA